jgi:hypothetical protein
MRKRSEPKFSVGQRVRMVRPNLYGETEGVIVRVERNFKSESGLVTMESTIKSIQLPYRFNGERLEVDHPEQDLGGFIQKAYTHVSVFSGYSYCVEAGSLRSIYPERALELLAIQI